MKKPMTFKRSRFKLTKFLAALHQFSLQHLGNGDPLPGVSGDIVYHDSVDLAEALSSDLGEEFGDIGNDSLKRLETGVSLYGQFAAFDGFDGFDCIDGQEVEVPNLDEEDEDDEPQMPRRRRTKKYLEAVENTPCDECTSFGFLISLSGDTVEIEPKAMRDVDGDCELEMVLEPNLVADKMRTWVRSFLFPKRRGKR
jgi:hypothetical protein